MQSKRAFRSFSFLYKRMQKKERAHQGNTDLQNGVIEAQGLAIARTGRRVVSDIELMTEKSR